MLQLEPMWRNRKFWRMVLAILLGIAYHFFWQGHPTVCPVCGQHLLEGISLTHTKITSVPPSPGKTQGYLIWVSLQQSVLGESPWNLSHSPFAVRKHTQIARPKLVQVGGWTNPSGKYWSKWVHHWVHLPQGSGWKYNIFELPPPGWA